MTANLTKALTVILVAIASAALGCGTRSSSSGAATGAAIGSAKGSSAGAAVAALMENEAVSKSDAVTDATGGDGAAPVVVPSSLELPAEADVPAAVTQVAAAGDSAILAAEAGSTAAAGAPVPFRFSEDESGRLQADRLTPPKRVPLSDFPHVSQPTASSPKFPDLLSLRLWTFPIADAGGESRSLPIEHPPIARVHPTYDRPPMPQFGGSLQVDLPEFTVAPRTRVPSERPDALPPLAGTLSPYEVKPTIQDDPSAPAARQALLSPLAFAEPVAAAPEKLTIPDPFEYLRQFQFRAPLAESIASETSFVRPSPIILPLSPE